MTNMIFKIICVVLFSSSALSRNVPSFKDLDEEDQMLFRAAYDSYDTPNFNHETPSHTSYNAPSYSYDNYNNNEIPIGKLDLLKDGMWALKAKMKELKAFNKALAANLLSTKLKVKQLMEHHNIIKPLKKHLHMEMDNKPVYNYQSPTPPSYPQYDQPQHTSPQYNAPAPQHYEAPEHVFDPYYGH